MAPKGGKLRGALDRYQGRNLKLERQRKLEKDATKRKQAKAVRRAEVDELEGQEEMSTDAVEGEDVVLKDALKSIMRNPESEQWSTEDEDEEEELQFDTARLEDSDSDSESDQYEDAIEDASQQNGSAVVNATEADDEEEGDEEEADIPLSDLSEGGDSDADIIPHQRLTINNTSALQRALSSFALKTSTMPFSEHQSLTTSEAVSISDVEDDLKRELAFLNQSLAAVKEARALLKAEGVSFSRPADYFAEMVKSDEHMGKIKAKLVDDAANKKAAADARRQRDLKKFGKQVQNEKLKERAMAKKDMMDKVNLLKRKRQGADLGSTNEEDLFDVALEDAATTDRKDRAARKGQRGAPTKRQKKDAKFGFGGKKRFAKSGDAISSADMTGYSVKRMKGKTGAANRPGKSRRQKQR